MRPTESELIFPLLDLESDAPPTPIPKGLPGDHALARFAEFLASGESTTAQRELAGANLRAEQTEDTVLRWQVLCAQTSLAMLAGRYMRAQRLAERYMELVEEIGDPDGAKAYALQMTWLRFERQGDTHSPNLHSAGSPAGELMGLIAGKPPLEAARAAESFETLEPHCARHFTLDFRLYLGPFALYLGQLSSELNDLDSAREYLLAAMAKTQPIGAVPWLARAKAEYARVILKSGKANDREEAIHMLEWVLAAARAIGARRLLREVSALLFSVKP